MWRVSWSGSFSEFCRTFETEEEARAFFASVIGKNKKLYHKKPDAFRLFVVRSACFWWACVLLPFCFL